MSDSIRSEHETNNAQPIPPNQARHGAMKEMIGQAGEQRVNVTSVRDLPIPSVPPSAVQALVIGKLQADLAQERFARMCLEFERSTGVRLADVEVGADGTLTRKAPSLL